jgi:VanZ family protein
LALVAAWTVGLLLPQPVPSAITAASPDLKFWLAKLVHLAVYAVLAALAGWLHAPRPGRWFLLAFLALHAGVVEWLQWTMDLGRDGNLRDVLLDLAGVATGAASTWKWWRD